MTDTDLHLLTDFRSEVPLPETEIAQRVYRRATAAGRRRWRSPRVVLVGIVVALALTGGAGAIAYHYLGSSPGFTAGFSAFDRLPAAAWPASKASSLGLEREAAYLGLTRAQAEKRLRLLQTGLTIGPGQGPGALYAIVGEGGTACMVVTDEGGTCLDNRTIRDFPGVMTLVLPYADHTAGIAAIVADNVRAIDLLVNGTPRPLTIVNNSVYTNLNDVWSPDTIALEANYTDGTSHRFPLASPGS